MIILDIMLLVTTDKSIRTIILIVVETSGLPLGQNRVLVHQYNNRNINRYNSNK